MTTVPAEIERIDRVCCDSTSGECATGVPTTCDAKCAVFFLNFYARCEVYINPSFSPSEIIALGQLSDTCAQALPTEPLLMTAAKCTGWTPGVPGLGTCKQALLNFQGGCSYDDQRGCQWTTYANGRTSSSSSTYLTSWESGTSTGYTPSGKNLDDVVGFSLAGISFNNGGGGFHGWGHDPELDVCLWTGVSCHPTTRTVVALNLNAGNNHGPLTNYIDSSHPNYGPGTITGDLGSLAGCPGLQVVLLKYSHVSGDVATLAALTQLKIVDLYGASQVTGDVSPLAALPQLHYLGLSGTHVTGRTAPFQARGLNCGSASTSSMPATCH